MDIQTTLAEAYHRSQVLGDHPGAVSTLRAAIAEPAAQAAAHAELARLALFMRSPRGRRGCHISRVTHGLLTEALSR